VNSEHASSKLVYKRRVPHTLLNRLAAIPVPDLEVDEGKKQANAEALAKLTEELNAYQAKTDSEAQKVLKV
jgi:hypothetical protein